MKIFISWSGIKSKKVAILLEDWIQGVIQAASPFISTNIEKGASWLDEINDQLLSFNFGIICLTLENKDKPWIHFEAGALAKGLQTNRVCTFLIDLENEEIQQPLAQFNHTSPNKEGVFNLINTINEHLLDKKLAIKTLEKVFELNWPDFEKRFSIISTETQNIANATKRTSEDILKEVLITMRGLDNRMRLIQKAYSTDALVNNLSKSKALADSNVKFKTALDQIAEKIPSLLEKGLTKKEIIDKVTNPFKSSNLRDPIVFDEWLNSIIDSHLK